MRIGREQDRENDERRAALARLRAEMDGAPGSAADADAAQGGWTLGDPALDGAVRLPVGALHEAVFAATRETGAATGFALALAARRLMVAAGEARPLLWCAARPLLAETGALSARGLADLGLDPARLLLASGRRDGDVLWTLEEAARSGAVALALGMAGTADLTATRRLSLAARAQGVPVLLLRHGAALTPSAARTRWRVAAAPSRPPAFADAAPGAPRWRVVLEKGWTHRPQHWLLEWDGETHRFHLAAPLADHAAGTRQAGAGGTGGPALALRRTG